MYTHIVQDGKEIIAPRMLYKSNSDGGWRVAYGYETGEGRYVKEAQEEGFAHYTQETKLAPEVVDALEVAPHTSDANGILTQDMRRIFATDSPDFQQTNSAPSEIGYYGDPSVDRLADPLRALSAGWLDKNTLNRMSQSGYESFGQYFTSLDKTFDKLEGFVPNFTKKPQVILTREHTLLGAIKIEDYPAKYGNKAIVWSMARDAAGRTWIDNIRLAEAEISSYGTYKTVFNGGLLTNKPLEYERQASGLNSLESHEFGDGYVDITPLLDNLLPIRQYKVAKGFR